MVKNPNQGGLETDRVGGNLIEKEGGVTARQGRVACYSQGQLVPVLPQEAELYPTSKSRSEVSFSSLSREKILWSSRNVPAMGDRLMD